MFKKTLSVLMAVVTAATASVVCLNSEAGAVSEVKEYTGHSDSVYGTPTIPTLISKKYNDEHYQETFYGSMIGKVDVGHYTDNDVKDGGYNVIVEDLEPTDIVTFSYTPEGGEEKILNVVIGSSVGSYNASEDGWVYVENMGLYYIDRQLGVLNSGVSVNEMISGYNKDLKEASQDSLWEYRYKDADAKARTFSDVEYIRFFHAFDLETGGYVNYGAGEWKITIAPGKKENSSKITNIASLSFSKISDKTYTGKAIMPSVTVKDGNKKLVKGTDYTIKYTNNTKIGTATATITGIGDYTGTKTIKFKIAPKKVKLSGSISDTILTLSWNKSKGATGYEIYYCSDGKKFTKLTTLNTVRCRVKITQGKQYQFKVRPYTLVNGKKVYGSWSNVFKSN